MKRDRLLRRSLFVAIILALLVGGLATVVNLAIASDEQGAADKPEPTLATQRFVGDGTSPPSVELIEQAYQAGRIDFDTAITYKVYSIFDQQKLPLEYQSAAPMKCATPILLEAARSWQLLKPATKSKLSSYPIANPGQTYVLYRPAFSGGESTYSTTHFQVHYTLSGADAVNPTDSNSNGIPDYIETMGTELENVWTAEITNMGWLRPPSDVSVDGSSDYDVYVKDLGTSTYGYTQFEGWADQGTALGDNENSPGIIEHYAAYSYIVLENDYSGFPNTPIDDIRVTAAHEFNHAIQFGYDAYQEGWLMEATATWMEDEVYDSINDNLQYLPSYLYAPDIAMSSQTPSRHWYGDWIFMRYTSEHYGGQSTIRRIWESCVNYNGFNAVQDALSSGGYSLPAVFSNFTVANYVKSVCPTNSPYCYREAASYPSVYIQGNINFNGSTVSYNPLDGVGNYGADYVAINSTVNNIRITVSGASPTTTYAVRVVRMQSGAPTVTDVPLSGSPQSGSVDVSTSDYSSVILIVENITPDSSSTTLQGYSVQVVSLEPTPTPTSAPTPPPIPTPTPIDISGSISGNGTVEQDIVYSVLDGQAVLNIARGTTALTAASGPLQSITVGEECIYIPAAPAGAYIIGCAYDYQPNGATFNPAATMTLKYDPGMLPAGVDASKLVIAYYDTAISKWVVIPSVVDTVNHTVTAQVSHFSLFAVYGTATTPVTGITREVNGSILPGVTITLDGIGPVVSDQNGQFQIMATATGNYTVTAHKDGFRDRTQIIEILGLGPEFAVTCNFQGNLGLIPNAPDMWYALDCVNRWLYPPDPDIGLTMWTALDVINAWLYPVQ